MPQPRRADARIAAAAAGERPSAGGRSAHLELDAARAGRGGGSAASRPFAAAGHPARCQRDGYRVGNGLQPSERALGLCGAGGRAMLNRSILAPDDCGPGRPSRPLMDRLGVPPNGCDGPFAGRLTPGPAGGRPKLGVRGGIRTHGPRIHPTSAFAAAPRNGAAICAKAFVVWTVPSPWAAAPAEAVRRRPSSLYTVPAFRPDLARDRHGLAAEAFPDFERIHGAVSGHRAQFRNQESCALSC